jgi:hypothetical protein
MWGGKIIIAIIKGGEIVLRSLTKEKQNFMNICK